MKRAGLLAIALLTTPTLHAAPGIAIYGGGYSWDTEFEGTVAAGGGNIDVQEDLGFDEADQSVFYLGLEHAVPVIPNARVRFMDLSDSASNRISRTFTFNGEAFVANTRVDSDFDLDLLDGTLYYSPLDNAVKLDVGLTVRNLDGQLRLNSIAGKTSKSIDETLPLLHVAARANLPATGVYVGAELNTISYDDNKMTDYNARVGWRSDFLLGLELGYSQLDLELDDLSGLDADLDMGGPYLALSLGF